MPPKQRATSDECSLRRHISEELTGVAESKDGTSILLVAREPDEGIVGFVWLSDRKTNFLDEVKAFVSGIYVAPDRRRHGIGESLMNAATEWAISRGHKRMLLNVAAHNDPAIELYRELGFDVNAITMSKDIA